MCSWCVNLCVNVQLLYDFNVWMYEFMYKCCMQLCRECVNTTRVWMCECWVNFMFECRFRVNRMCNCVIILILLDDCVNVVWKFKYECVNVVDLSMIVAIVSCMCKCVILWILLYECVWNVSPNVWMLFECCITVACLCVIVLNWMNGCERCDVL